jgi:hypothetical protein
MVPFHGMSPQSVISKTSLGKPVKAGKNTIEQEEDYF